MRDDRRGAPSKTARAAFASIVALMAMVASMTLAPALAGAETLTNDSIVELTKAGLGPDAILAKIQTSANAFDMSTQQLLALKHQGVSDPVIGEPARGIWTGG